MHLSFSKINEGITVQFVVSCGPQNKAHHMLTCLWEPATLQSESNHINLVGHMDII